MAEITSKKLARAIVATALDLYGRWEGSEATGFAGSALVEVQLTMELEPIVEEHMQAGRTINAAYCLETIERVIEILNESYGAKSKKEIDFSPEALIAAQEARNEEDEDDD